MVGRKEGCGRVDTGALVPGNILDLTISLEDGSMMMALLEAVGNQMRPHPRSEWPQSLETLNLPMVKEACG